jgi:hypothetical protein
MVSQRSAKALGNAISFFLILGFDVSFQLRGYSLDSSYKKTISYLIHYKKNLNLH